MLSFRWGREQCTGTDYAWITDCHLRHLCLSPSSYLPSNNANNNSRVNILVYSDFWSILSFLIWIWRGWNIFFFSRSFCLRLPCVESVIISSIPSECTFSPLWPDLAPPLSIETPEHKGDDAGALEGLFVLPVGVWFAAGKKKRKHCAEKEALFWLPLLQSIICKHSLREFRRSGRLINTHVFHNKHAEYVWEHSSMQHPPPLFISLLNDTFDAVPWHRSCILRKWLNLEVRCVRALQEESWNLNTHVTDVSSAAARACHTDRDSLITEAVKWDVSPHSCHVFKKHSSFPDEGVSSVHLSKHDLKGEHGEIQTSEKVMKPDLRVSLTSPTFKPIKSFLCTLLRVYFQSIFLTKVVTTELRHNRGTKTSLKRWASYLKKKSSRRSLKAAKFRS